jgi:prevent-host-death family protein
MIVTVGHAKANFSKLLAAVARGEEVVIARGATPVARLTPIPACIRPAGVRREFGALRGKISLGPAFFDPLSRDELEAWGED